MPLAIGKGFRAEPLTFRIDTGVWLVALVAAHIAVATAVALYSHFPSSYDEIAHLSFVKAMADAPVLFPHYGAYRLLDPQDLSLWTSEPNYIAHPSLYYLLMAPIWHLSGGSVLALRLADVCLSAAGLALTAGAGAKLIESPRLKLLFILLVFCFPKNPIIGGIVSNDNLVLLATGFFLLGCASPSRRGLWMGLALILAGWTKLTAFVGLGTAAGVFMLQDMWHETRREHRFRLSRQHVAIMLAMLVAAVPYGVYWARSGHLLYEPENSFWIIPVERREQLDMLGFLQVFFRQIVHKFPAADRMMNDAVPLALLVCLSLFAIGAKAEERARRVALSFLIALAVFMPIHFAYAWQTFLSSGENSDAQPRYYNELWPGFALALTLAAGRLDGRRLPVVASAVAIACLLPTAAGLLFFVPPTV